MRSVAYKGKGENQNAANMGGNRTTFECRLRKNWETGVRKPGAGQFPKISQADSAALKRNRLLRGKKTSFHRWFISMRGSKLGPNKTVSMNDSIIRENRVS